MDTKLVDPCIAKLFSISSPALLNGDFAIDAAKIGLAGSNGESVAAILRMRNGFFAFEGALRFFPSKSIPISYGLPEWNSSSLWRDQYGELVYGCYFFAEDIFGGQFCLKDNAVFKFDAETADLEYFAESVVRWSERLLENGEALTGHKLAKEWQSDNSRINGRDRLFPKIPFVLGGEFSVSNLVAIDAAKGMRLMGELARQIRSLPDGSKIKFEFSK